MCSKNKNTTLFEQFCAIIKLFNRVYPIEQGASMSNNQGQRIAYVRVSTVEQNEARQLELLSEHDIYKIFIDKMSGQRSDRPELNNMLEYIRSGDTVYVTELSRLGRSTFELLDLVQKIQDKGATFISLKENFDTSTPSGRLQFTMLAAISQFEREMILERQREGIAIAKKNNKYKGRGKIHIDNIEEYYQKYMNHEMSKAEIARILGISRNTLERRFKERRTKHE